MSRIAYIISVYKDPDHLLRLIKSLDDRADFYIHVDRKTDSLPFEERVKSRATFVPNHWVSWGGWGQVKYQKELLKAVLNSGIAYSRIVCLSGQDYPLWSNERIHQYFDENQDKEFVKAINITQLNDPGQLSKINQLHLFRDLEWKNLWLKNKLIVTSRLLMSFLPLKRHPTVHLDKKQRDVYFGSDYWAITLPCAQYLYQKLCTEQAMIRYFRTSFAPSEMCIQTIIFNSPFAPKALHHQDTYKGLYSLTPLHHIEYGKTIKSMQSQDWSNLQQSGKMFCRKIESGTSDSLVQIIDLDRKTNIR